MENGKIIDKETGIVRGCIENCKICSYEKENGPEICLDSILNTINQKKEIKIKCHHNY